jgi:hypothetical protein
VAPFFVFVLIRPGKRNRIFRLRADRGLCWTGKIFVEYHCVDARLINSSPEPGNAAGKRMTLKNALEMQVEADNGE